MIDSHCHLNFPAIKADIKNVIKRSKASGVTKLLTINTNPDEFDDHYSLIKEYENIIAYIIYDLKNLKLNIAIFTTFIFAPVLIFLYKSYVINKIFKLFIT